MTFDPRAEREAAREAVAVDPERAARVARVVARLRAQPYWRLRNALRPRTETEAWADFEAAEASTERERDRS